MYICTKKKEKMNKLELYIKEKEINISDLERKLKLPSGSIRITGRGIPSKHIESMTKLLKSEYGFNSDLEVKQEVDIPDGKPIVQKIWNKNFIPDYHDGILRYQDPENGLWKRLLGWQSHVVKETGEVKVNEEFLPASKEIFTDKLGRFYVAKNGIKVYKFDKIIKL